MSSRSPRQNHEEVSTETLTLGLDPELDSVFQLFVSQRRRYVLDCLRETDDPIPLADLAGEVATREKDASLSEIPDEELKQIHLTLYHTHIPKLNDEDIIQYNKDEETVTLIESVEKLNQYEELLPDK